MERLLPSLVVLLSFLVVASLVVQAQPANPKTIVDQHYPIARLEPEKDIHRRSCYKVAASMPDGTPSRIVAGYTDTLLGVLRMLERDASGVFNVSYESPTSPVIFGAECEITLVDIDGDGANDVFLDMMNRGSTVWIFRSLPSGLENITPLSDNGSALNSAGMVDLYHDGTVQIATGGGEYTEGSRRVTQLPAIYKVSGSSMVLDSRVLMVSDFEAGDSVDRALRSRLFSLLEGGTGPYLLRIVNGTRSGQRRGTAISISINGVPLQGTAAFSDRVEFLDLPISMELLDENEIEVVLKGSPDASVEIVIRKQAQ